MSSFFVARNGTILVHLFGCGTKLSHQVVYDLSTKTPTHYILVFDGAYNGVLAILMKGGAYES